MSATLENFRDDIETFLATRNMRASKFGSLALNDPSFVMRLRNGANVKVSTIDKVRAWMRDPKQRPDEKNAA